MCIRDSYMNSQLIHMEAEINGYQEGIGLDVNGLVSEGSGENIFVVRNGVLYKMCIRDSFWALGKWPACVAFIVSMQLVALTIALVGWRTPADPLDPAHASAVAH